MISISFSTVFDQVIYIIAFHSKKNFSQQLCMHQWGFFFISLTKHRWYYQDILVAENINTIKNDFACSNILSEFLTSDFIIRVNQSHLLTTSNLFISTSVSTCWVEINWMYLKKNVQKVTMILLARLEIKRKTWSSLIFSSFFKSI
jgi:hypothetical protein